MQGNQSKSTGIVQFSTMKERPQRPVNSGGLMDPDIEGPKVGIGEGVGIRTIPAG